MKKNKTTNNLQILSPENYIRQKSRNLPVRKCYVNKDWEATKMCQALVVREHASGNVTVCIYLVDLGCLGIKDTFYKFNVTWEDIDEILHIYDDDFFIEAPYELVHNVIYAAIEYAEDYGFKPHKDFTSITSYFLEEDTEDIPLMPIGCGGDDGNPLYVNSGADSPARAKQIMAQLDKTAGKGNYHYILKADGADEDQDENEDEDEDDDYDEEENEVAKEIRLMSMEERKKQFIELILKDKTTNDPIMDEDVTRIVFLCRFLSYDLADREVIDKQLNRLEDVFDHEIVEDDELPNSLFTDVQNMEEERIVDLFFDALNMINKKKSPKKVIAQIREEAGNVPVADFLELFHFKEKESKKFKQKVEESFQRFPNYFLIQIYRYIALSERDWEVDTQRMDKLLSDEKQPITEFEAEFFFLHYTGFLIQKKTIDLNEILAFEEYLQSRDYFSGDTCVEFFAIFSAIKMDHLVKHFIKTGELSE